jgi:hypothetical protein
MRGRSASALRKKSCSRSRALALARDTGKSGKISKQEWMSFMEAEFNRLDVKKDGELDAKELTQSQLRVSHFGSVRQALQ